MKRILRRLHESVVRLYIPADDETELAEALFNWKFKN